LRGHHLGDYLTGTPHDIHINPSLSDCLPAKYGEYRGTGASACIGDPCANRRNTRRSESLRAHRTAGHSFHQGLIYLTNTITDRSLSCFWIDVEPDHKQYLASHTHKYRTVCQLFVVINWGAMATLPVSKIQFVTGNSSYLFFFCW